MTLRRRHVYESPDLTGRKPATVVMSNGLGVDSMALLHQWCTDPSTRDFPLDELLIVTAVVGNEYEATIAAANAHMVPMLRAHGIRYLQVARGGKAAEHGYDVLADSLAPTEVVRRGAWHLGQEMDEALTVPRIVKGRRECSARAKGEVLDAAVADEIAAGNVAPGYRHVIAYAAEEVDRVEKDNSYTTNARTPWHPLVEMKQDRAWCDQYLYDLFGFHWPRSCCVFCLMWNLSWLVCWFMIAVRWERYPLVDQHSEARRWLQFTANIGRAWNTVDAYGRAVDDHLAFCLTVGAGPDTARPDVVAAWIGDMHQRPNPNGGVGLANSTIQVRIVGVRSFYDFLVEEGIRDRNPVRRGQSSRHGRRAKQGLVRRVEKAPWIPNEDAWERILRACETEPVRNRLMVTFAYDGALRREELVSLEPGDLEPAWSLIHLRAETTKSKRAREVSFGTASAQLLVAYLRQRGERFGRVDGGLFLSESRRNRGEVLGRSSWSKIVTGIAKRAGEPRLSTHTFRHLRLTDLARAGWSIEEIAQYAGHRDLSTTLKYIHLSGRELAAKLHKATRSLQADRERRLAALVEAW